MTPVTRNLLFQRRQKRRVRRMASWCCSAGRCGAWHRGAWCRSAWARGAFGAGVRSWQDYALMRSQAFDDGKMLAKCVPGRQSVASFALHASRKRPRTGKSPVRGKIRTPCIRKRAGLGRICAPCIRNAPQTAVGGYTARRSCQEGALFAARAPRIMHGAQILPSSVDETPWRPQSLCRRPAPNRPSARNPSAAEQRGTARAAHNHAAALMAANHPQHSRCQRQPHRKRSHTPPPRDTEASGGREILRRPSSAAPKRNSGPTAP